MYVSGNKLIDFNLNITTIVSVDGDFETVTLENGKEIDWRSINHKGQIDVRFIKTTDKYYLLSEGVEIFHCEVRNVNGDLSENGVAVNFNAMKSFVMSSFINCKMRGESREAVWSPDNMIDGKHWGKFGNDRFPEKLQLGDYVLTIKQVEV